MSRQALGLSTDDYDRLQIEAQALHERTGLDLDSAMALVHARGMAEGEFPHPESSAAAFNRLGYALQELYDEIIRALAFDIKRLLRRQRGDPHH